MSIYEPGTPSWSSSEYSSTPSILSIKEEVVYPWEIDVLISHINDVQECRLVMMKTTLLLRTPNELMVEGPSRVTLNLPRVLIE